jgi:hypothetical protein
MEISMHRGCLTCLIAISLTCNLPADGQAIDTRADVDVSEALNRQLIDAHPGQIIQADGLTLGESTIPIIPVARHDAGGPQFLLSDMPEYFRTGDGIAMRERVEPGRVRFYLYHVPEPTDARKTITAVIENVGDATMHMRFLRYAVPTPGKDYHKIGKQGLIDFFDSTPSDETRELAAGERMVFDPLIDQIVVGKDDLVHGFYEFQIDQPAVVTTLQRDPDEDSVRVVDQLAELPRILPGFHPSGAGRGLFLTSDFDVAPAEDGFALDTADGPRQVIIADGKRDPWITGRDSIDGETDAPLKGNYGVVYKVRLNYTSSDGRGVALLVYNSRGDGKWCKYQALALQANEGEFPAGTVAAPKDAVRYGPPPDAVLIQRYPPVAAGQTGTIEVTYSPPGASCLPVPLLFVPYER